MYDLGPAPRYPNNADVNRDCELGAGDVEFLINYLYRNGPRPLQGCVSGGAPGEETAGDNVSSTPQVPTLGNYPNPFNPATTIHYTLQERARVSIDIFNLLGQKVTTLVNCEQDAGDHVALWNGLDESGEQVASGAYFYRLEIGGEVLTRKMMLLK